MPFIKRFLKLFLSLLFYIFIHEALFSQVLKAPRIYSRPTLSKQDVQTDESSPRGNRDWRVWVIKNGVRNGGNEFSFLQSLLIKKENKDSVEVIDPITNESQGILGKSDLLLWNEALGNDNNFRIKAMAVITPETLRRGNLDEITRNQLTFYESPTTNSVVKFKSGVFDIYYLYKQIPGWLLLGKRNQIGNGRAKDVIYGWAKRENLFVWDNRLALEPNWQSNAVQERVSKDFKIQAFETVDEIENYQEYGISDEALWEGIHKKKWDPFVKRLPVLEYDLADRGIFKVGIESAFFSEVDGEVKEIKELTQEERIIMDKLYETQHSRFRKINICFILDGTESMDPYYSYVRDGIEESINILKKGDSENKIFLALTVYRDKADDFPIEVISNLTNDYQSVLDKIGSIKAISDPDDTSYDELMYSGIDDSFGNFITDTTSTNVFILIGDAGGNDGYKEASVLDKLGIFDVSFLAIQVNRKYEADEDFISQVSRLISKHAIQVHKRINSEMGNISGDFRGDPPKFERNENKPYSGLNYFEIINPAFPIHGGIQYKLSKSKPIKPELVGTIVKGLIDNIDKRNSDLIQKIENEYRGVSEDSINGRNEGFSPVTANFLLKSGISRNIIELLQSRRYQFLLEGFVTLESEKASAPLLNKVLFMDQVELDLLLASLEIFNFLSGTDFDKREQLKTVLKESIKANYGINDFQGSFGEIIELFIGLPPQTGQIRACANYTLEQIHDIPEDCFENMEEIMRDVFNLLEAINGNSQYKFLDGGYSYYWIPITALP